MSFISTLLSRSQHQVSTRQALMVVGMQNDFTSPDGKLPVNSADGYMERIRQLVPAFREHGEIFWIRSEYKQTRLVNDPSGNGCMVIADDEFDLPASGGNAGMGSYLSRPSVRSSSRINEVVQRTMDRAANGGEETASASGVDQDLFLSQADPQDNCCLPGSWGAEFSPGVRDLISPRDVQIVKSYYSAFTSSSLLLMLRAKFITELYVVGCTTNLSVYATALDAAQHGLTINLVEDCLNYRHRERHERAVQRLVDIMGASVTFSASVLSRLGGDSHSGEASAAAGTGSLGAESHDPNGVRSPSPVDDRERRLERLRLREASTVANDRDRQLAPAQRAESTSFESSDTAGRRPSAGPVPHEGTPGPDGTREPRPEPGPSLTRDVGGGAGRVTQHDQSSTLREKPDTASQCAPDLGVAESPDLLCPIENEDIDAGAPLSDPKTLPPRHSPKPSTDFTARSAGRDSAGETRSSERVTRKPHGRRRDKTATQKPLGPGDKIGSGGSRVISDLLEHSLAGVVFQQLYHEVHWQRMYHVAGEVPRLVCCQGDIDASDGSMPVYRHPADQTLPLLRWSASVARIKREAEKRVGHKLNHALIQLYRNGQDYISEHSDKTLDIVPGSSIVNVSLGAQRTMRLRTKRTTSNRRSGLSPAKRQTYPSDTNADTTIPSPSTPRSQWEHDQARARTTQRIPMPHNSMFVMDLETNGAWLHGISQDRRLLNERSAAEASYGGMRISLTFRNIGTFISSDSSLIWGQGATGKQREEAKPSLNGAEHASQMLIDAFGFENQSTSRDWHEAYGTGSDVLHLKSGLPEKEKPILFLSGDDQSDLAVKSFVKHLGIDVETIHLPPRALANDLTDANGKLLPQTESARKPCFRDAGPAHAQVEGEIPILLFLDRYHTTPTATAPASKAKELELLTSTLRHRLRHTRDADTALRHLEELLIAQSSEEKNERGHTTRWLAGSDFGVADCAFWPVVRDTRSRSHGFDGAFPELESWLARVGEKVGSVREPHTSDAS